MSKKMSPNALFLEPQCNSPWPTMQLSLTWTAYFSKMKEAKSCTRFFFFFFNWNILKYVYHFLAKSCFLTWKSIEVVSSLCGTGFITVQTGFICEGTGFILTGKKPVLTPMKQVWTPIKHEVRPRVILSELAKKNTLFENLCWFTELSL